LDSDVEWTIVGSSPLAKTYKSKKEFVDQVIDPFNARMSTLLVLTIRGIYADGDKVIILFDAEATVKDGNPYHNTYTWYFQMKNAKVIKAIGTSTNSGTEFLRNLKMVARAPSTSHSPRRKAEHGDLSCGQPKR
jgi:hypothetical protein